MSRPTTEHNLLFGAAALQLGLVSPGTLVAILRIWSEDKSRPLGALLRERDVLRAEEEDLILSLLQSLLHRHGNDALRVLSSLMSPVAMDRLSTLDDPELRDCLNRLAS